MATSIPFSKLKGAKVFSKKVASTGEPSIAAKNGCEEFVMPDQGLIKTYRKMIPEEKLEWLLSEADRDIATGQVSSAKDGLSKIRQAYGL